MVPPGGQICNLCKWCHLVAKFAANANGAIWWPNLQLMQVGPSGGQICNLCKWCHIVAKFNPSHRVNFWARCASSNIFLLTLCWEQKCRKWVRTLKWNQEVNWIQKNIYGRKDTNTCKRVTDNCWSSSRINFNLMDKKLTWKSLHFCSSSSWLFK